jgi:hypothetical protein
MPAAPRRSASASTGGLEQRLRQLFPRHHLQDEFMHIATIAAFFMALIGFVLGFFFAYSWLATNFLLGAIALILFLILRESTLSHIRPGGGSTTGGAPGGRYQVSRSSAGGPPEAATTQSSPRPPAAPPPPSRA